MKLVHMNIHRQRDLCESAHICYFVPWSQNGKLQLWLGGGVKVAALFVWV